MPLLAAVCLLATGPARPARADYDETERRLAVAGVDADLRARIHQGIDRGVECLAKRQIGDGSYLDPAAMGGLNRDGVTVLCALALRHAATPAAREPLARAMKYLFDARREPRDALVNEVYSAGLAAMLLMGDASREKEARRTGAGIVHGQDLRTGWWGYFNGGDGSPSSAHDMIQLSTTQFAGLGLCASVKSGVAVPRTTWDRHARGLATSQTADGSWGYMPAGKAGYPTGTFMGLANLLLAEAALGDLTGDPDLLRAVGIAKRKGLVALARDGAAVLDALADGGTGAWAIGGASWSYYGLYALEKACIFADVERCGDVAWYPVGAEGLLRLQGTDGGWGGVVDGPAGRQVYRRSDLVSTAFALLFLLRSAESFHPTTPSPIDTPRPKVTTPTDPPPAVPPPAPTPPAKPR